MQLFILGTKLISMIRMLHLFNAAQISVGGPKLCTSEGLERFIRLIAFPGKNGFFNLVSKYYLYYQFPHPDEQSHPHHSHNEILKYEHSVTLGTKLELSSFLIWA